MFNSTLVIIDYDENDGQFDHVPPPVPAAGSAGEFHLDAALAPVPLPVGLGFRVRRSARTSAPGGPAPAAT